MRGRAIVACTAWVVILAAPATAARPAHSPRAHQRTPVDATELQQRRDPLAPTDQEADPSWTASADATRLISWVASSNDNNSMPYLVVDKAGAAVFAFDSANHLVAATPALVGMKQGDESTPGVGDRELSHIPPEDRMTPAGRFVAKLGRAAGHRDVLWIDYTTAISMHPVIAVRNQRRFERLKSATPDDNRITYGCINVPAAFYAKVVRPLFKNAIGVVYILPETKPLSSVFLSMPPAEQSVTPAAWPITQPLENRA